jgi:hypothetical protein
MDDKIFNKPSLISKNIELYFDDLVKVPEPPQIGGSFSLSKFYSEYMEHNILLLFIILCLVIFLIVKYINKNYYENTIHTIKNENDIENNEFLKNTNKIKKKLSKDKLLKIKRHNEKEKRLLELEKQTIMDIIEELSIINNEKMQHNNKIINQTDYLQDNYLQDNYLQENYSQNNYLQDNYVDNNFSLINNNIETSTDFYSINKNVNYKNKKSPNYIKGLYIETPFEE